MLLAWLINTIAVFVTAELLPGFTVKGLKGAIITAAILGLLQALFGKLLYGIIGIGTLGIGFALGMLTKLVVMSILLVVTDKLADSLKIKSFGTAVVGAVIITVLSTIGTRLLG